MNSLYINNCVVEASVLFFTPNNLLMESELEHISLLYFY